MKGGGRGRGHSKAGWRECEADSASTVSPQYWDYSPSKRLDYHAFGFDEQRHLVWKKVNLRVDLHCEVAIKESFWKVISFEAVEAVADFVEAAEDGVCYWPAVWSGEPYLIHTLHHSLHLEQKINF